jgi:hypothetical protein
MNPVNEAFLLKLLNEQKLKFEDIIHEIAHSIEELANLEWNELLKVAELR